MEGADGVAPPSHAGHEQVREPALCFQQLRPDLPADDALEVPHHGGVGMGPGGRAHQVMGALDAPRPIAQRLVYSILEQPGAGPHLMHLGPQELHAEDVHALPRHVPLAHVHLRPEAEHGGGHGGGHPVLPRPRLRDEPLLPHAPGQERLPHHVVELVRPAVAEVLPLQVDLRPAAHLREAPGEVKGGLPPSVMPVVIVQLLPEGRVRHGVRVFPLQLHQGGHQDLWHVLPSVLPEPGVHSNAPLIAAISSLTFSGSLPSSPLTPLETSSA